MSPQYIVQSQIRKLAKSLKMRISPETIIILNGIVSDIVKKAAERSKMNRRKTITKQDI